MNILKQIEVITVEGRDFTVVEFKANGKTWYGTILNDYINKDGSLNRDLNGMDMEMEPTLRLAKVSREHTEHFEKNIRDYMEKNGCDRKTAINSLVMKF